MVGQLGPLSIYVFGLTTALGFAAGTLVSLLQAERLGLAAARLFQAAPLVMAAGVLGARAGYVLIHLSEYRFDWAAAARLQEGGFVFYGGLVAGAAALFWYARRTGMDGWRALDAAAPGLALGQAVGLVGAQMPGRATDVPWAVALGGETVHPLAAYGIIFSYGLFFVVWRLTGYSPGRGRLFLAYLFLHAWGWLFIDIWAPGPRFLGLTLGQWTNLLAAGAAAYGFAKLPRGIRAAGSVISGGPMPALPITAGTPLPTLSVPAGASMPTVSGPAAGVSPAIAPGSARFPMASVGGLGHHRAARQARLWRAGAWLGGLAVLLGLYGIRWI